MATGAGRHEGVAGSMVSGIFVEALPATQDSDARYAASVSPLIIEISDKDYRSFCLPCYALEETGDCNAGY